MNDAPNAAQTGFDAGRLRTAPTQMLRSRDDRYLAGVCGGLARYLNLDPVVIRVLLAALTVVGGVGLVLYLAAWLLAPEEGADRSVLESHLPANPHVRTVGWLIAGVLAVGAVVGSGPWFTWGWFGPFPLLGLAVLIWLLARRPRTGDGSDAAAVGPPPEADDAPPSDDSTRPTPDAVGTVGAAPPPPPPEPPLEPDATTPAPAPRPPRRDADDGLLTWLTLAVLAAAAGVVWLVDQSGVDIEGPTYLVTALVVIAAGTLAGSWWGNGRWLIPLGVATTAALIVVSTLPDWKFGQIKEAPTQATDVRSSYVMGAGQIDLDLTQVEDLDALDGRTITFESGMGQTRVLVPESLDVTVDAAVTAGEVTVFDRSASGGDASTHYTDVDDADPDLRLELDGSFGQLEVTRA